jgi:hypothetical protein
MYGRDGEVGQEEALYAVAQSPPGGGIPALSGKEEEDLAKARQDASLLTGRELKALLTAHGIDYSDCVEKGHLCERLRTAVLERDGCGVVSGGD